MEALNHLSWLEREAVIEEIGALVEYREVWDIVERMEEEPDGVCVPEEWNH